jgi:hypothetical protein
MTDDMIERVARAIAGCETADDWGDLTSHWQEQFRKEARAAIEAMREPTTDMCEAGWDGFDDANVARSVWHAMIDAALKGQNSP